jgi:hypothetical protein
MGGGAGAEKSRGWGNGRRGKNIHAGYSIIQRIKVHSTAVDRVPKLAGDTATLIDGSSLF